MANNENWNIRQCLYKLTNTKVFLAVLIFLVLALIATIWYNSYAIRERAKESNQELVAAMSLFAAQQSYVMVSVDSLGEAKLDSIRCANSEYSEEIREIITKQSVDRITEYSESLAENFTSSINILMLWATLLTLLAIIFSFLGYLEVRDKVREVMNKGKEMDQVKEEAAKDWTDMKRKIYQRIDAIAESMNKNLDEFENAKTELRETKKDLEQHIIISKLTDCGLEYKYKILTELNKNSFNIDVSKNLICSLKEEINKDKNFDENQTDSENVRQKKKKLRSELKSICDFQVGNIYLNINRQKEAIEWYAKAINEYPTVAFYHNNLGYAHIKEREPLTAIPYLKKAIELKPNYTTAYNNLGYCQNKLGMYDEAIVNLEKAIELNPKYARAYKNLGYSYYKRLPKNDTTALTYAKQAIKLDKGFIDAYELAAKIYNQMQEYGKAIEILETALNEIGNSCQCMQTQLRDRLKVKSQLVVAHCKCNDKAAAKSYFDKLKQIVEENELTKDDSIQNYYQEASKAFDEIKE